jgi:hypothetical protein
MKFNRRRLILGLYVLVAWNLGFCACGDNERLNCN